MAGPGEAPQPTVSEGDQQIAKYRSAGFTGPEIAQWQLQKTSTLQKAGFTQQEIDGYWGVHTNDSADVHGIMQQNPAPIREATTPLEMFQAGWQNSDVGLSVRGKMPDLVAPEHTGLFNDIAGVIGQEAGDLPMTVAGFVGGGGAGVGAGAAVPGAGETGVSEVGGGVLGAYFGAGAAPQAYREALIDSYTTGQRKTWGEFAQAVSDGTWRTMKAGTISMFTGKAGEFGGHVATRVGARPFVAGGANAVTAAATATTVSAGMEGRLPNAQDFVTGAVTMLGLHVAGASVPGGRFVLSEAGRRVQNNLQQIYRRFGITPQQASAMAARNPGLRDEIMQQDVHGDAVTPGMAAAAPDEPTFKTNAHAIRDEHEQDVRDMEGGGALDAFVEKTLPMVRGLEDSGDSAISSAGAIGRYQIMPGTARQYGFDPNRLTDPAYNEQAARVILSDLSRRFKGDQDAVLAAYNGGPGRAAELLKQGPGTRLEAVEGKHGWTYERVASNRDESKLPMETQEYIARGRAMSGQEGLTSRVDNYKQAPWQGVADPNSVASYLQKFGERAGFNFAVGPKENMPATEAGPAFRKFSNGATDVYIPDTPEELSQRWYGLGKREIMFHEISHAIDYHVLHNDARVATESDLSMYPGLKDELRQASREYAPKLWDQSPDHKNKPQELMADGIAKWMSDPTYRDKMPIFNKAFGDLLQPYLDIANSALPELFGYKENEETTPPGGGGKKPPPPPPGGSGEGEEPKRIEGPKKPDEEDILRKLNPDSLRDRFLDNVGVPGEKHVSVRSGLGMELDAARRLDKNLVNAGLLDPKKQIGITDMARQTYGSDGRWAHFLNKGPVDAITLRPIDGISAKDVADEIDKTGLSKDHFNMYLMAQRTIEKAAQGIDLGVFKGGLEEAKIIASNPKLQKLDGAVDMFQQFMNSGLKYARDSGILNDSQVNKITAKNLFYIPARKLQGDETLLQTRKSGIQGWLGVRNPVTRMFGGEKEQIIDPWLASMDNMRMLIRMSDRNRAAGAAYNALKQLGPQDSGLVKIAAPNIEVEDKGVFKKAFVEEGAAKAMNNFVAPKQYGTKGSNTFMYYDNGKPIVLEARDPDLARLYQGAETPAEATMISKVASLPARMARAGIAALDPTFGPRVILRHSQTAYIASDIHPFPILNLMRGVFDAFGETNKYWEVMASGAGGGSIVDIDRHVNDIRDAQRLFDQTGTAEKVWNTFKHPIEAMQYVQDRLAMANKIGAYKKATGTMGLEPAKAGMKVRETFLDYREKFVSAQLQAWSKYVPFFHADILGLRQGWEAIQPGKLPKTAMYATLGMILPQIALRAMNHWADQSLPDEKKYKNLPAWERDMYYVTPEIYGQRVRIAKPYNFGPLVSAPLDAVIDKMLEDNPHALDTSRFVSDFMDAAPNVMPTMASAPIENLTNYSFFAGKPLIPDSVKERTADLQYTSATSEPAKALSRLLGHHGGYKIADVSPMDVDNLVQGWTGTAGKIAMKALGTPFTTDNPPWQMADIPFAGSFFVRNPGAGAKPIEDFYTDYMKLEQDFHNTTFEKKQMDMPGYMQDIPKARMYQRMKGIHDSLSIMRAALDGINKNAKMSDAEKQQATDNTVRQMIVMAEDGERAMNGNGK